MLRHTSDWDLLLASRPPRRCSARAELKATAGTAAAGDARGCRHTPPQLFSVPSLATCRGGPPSKQRMQSPATPSHTCKHAHPSKMGWAQRTVLWMLILAGYPPVHMPGLKRRRGWAVLASFNARSFLNGMGNACSGWMDHGAPSVVLDRESVSRMADASLKGGHDQQQPAHAAANRREAAPAPAQGCAAAGLHDLAPACSGAAWHRPGRP